MASSHSRRVALAGLHFETNSFAPGATSLDDFRRRMMASGPEIFTAGLGRDELAGARAVAESAGVRPVPVFCAGGLAGATVAATAHQALRDRLLAELAEVIDEVDGVYLWLHGAMVAEDSQDVEGELLQAVRELAGPGKPVAASCDFHAHFTPRMAAATDLIAGYHTCPHTDYYETGERAMRLLLGAMSGDTHPVLRHRKVPMTSPAESHDTRTGPLVEVMARLRRITAEPGVLDATVFATQPWLDVAGHGWAAAVVTDGDPELAQDRADELALMMWQRREQTASTRIPIAAALQQVRESAPEDRPFVIADGSDSPSAGARGDSTALLATLLEDPLDDDVMLTIVDPQAAAACHAAGVGADVSLRIGGRLTPDLFEPVEVKGRVVTLSDGAYDSIVPPRRINAGATAVLRIGRISLVVTERAVSQLDDRLYRQVGLEPAAAKVVGVKSAGSYRSQYETFAHRCLDVAAPGPADSRLEQLPYTRISRPLWPFDRDIDTPW